MSDGKDLKTQELDVKEYAWLSSAVYRRSRENQLKAEEKGWTRVAYISDNPEDAEYAGPEARHFSAGVYVKDNDIVIAFAGTNTELEEHQTTNIPAGFGVQTEQVWRALKLTLEVMQQAMKENPPPNISFTGHSLGGGLASLMGMFFDKKATVFDQAPFGMSAQNLGTIMGYYERIQNEIAQGKLSAELPAGFQQFMDEMQAYQSSIISFLEDTYGNDPDYVKMGEDGVFGDKRSYNTIYSWRNVTYKVPDYAERFKNVNNYYIQGEVLEYLRKYGQGAIDLSYPLLGLLQDFVPFFDPIKGQSIKQLETIGVQEDAIVIGQDTSISDTVTLHSMVLLNAALESEVFRSAMVKHTQAIKTIFDTELYARDLNVSAKEDFLNKMLRNHVMQMSGNNPPETPWLDLIGQNLELIKAKREPMPGNGGEEFEQPYTDAACAFELYRGQLAALTEYWYYRPLEAQDSAFTALINGVEIDLNKFAEGSDKKGQDALNAALIFNLKNKLQKFFDHSDLSQWGDRVDWLTGERTGNNDNAYTHYTPEYQMSELLKRAQESTLITIANNDTVQQGMIAVNENEDNDFVWGYNSGINSVQKTGKGNDTLIGSNYGGGLILMEEKVMI